MPCKRAKRFDAQVAILDLLEHKPILTTGYECVSLRIKFLLKLKFLRYLYQSGFNPIKPSYDLSKLK